MRSAHASYGSPSRAPIKNGSVAPRNRKATRLRTAPQQEIAPRPRRKLARKRAKAPLPNGLSVMGLLVVVLAAIGGMLVVSLNWQRNAHSLAQEEVALRSSLNYVADERQQLVVDERRAINPRFTAARAADAGLSEIKLDERATAAKPTAKTTKSAVTTNNAATNAAAKPLPASPKPVKPTATAANTTKPATTIIAAKTPQPAPKPTHGAVPPSAAPLTVPAMPPTIARNASVKAALAR